MGSIKIKTLSRKNNTQPNIGERGREGGIEEEGGGGDRGDNIRKSQVRGTYRKKSGRY